MRINFEANKANSTGRQLFPFLYHFNNTSDLVEGSAQTCQVSVTTNHLFHVAKQIVEVLIMNIHMKLLVASGEKQLKLHHGSTTYIHS